MTGVYKDEILVALAGVGNVARFASFAPDGTLRHALPPAPPGATILEVVTALLAAAPAGTLNVRTFRPEAPEGNPFIFGLPTAAAVTACVVEHLAAGLHVIVNETIPLHDGGIGGGVCQDGVVELVPGTTPRGVENGDPASMPAAIAAEAVRIMFGVDITDALDDGSRTEFSIHPYRCGTRNGPLLVWERRPVEPAPRDVVPSWPNALSRFVGDKAYGLLMAHLYGARVPRTTVVSRHVAPFTFGTPTGEPGRWSRAVPAVKLPGELPTFNRWVDPFVMAAGCGNDLTSILAQDDVPAQFSGAAIVTADDITIEGAHGYGDDFMLGVKDAQVLPASVVSRVRNEAVALRSAFGPCTFEWVVSTGRAWVLQVNQMPAAESDLAADTDLAWVEFDAAAGVDALRVLVAGLPPKTGVVVRGNVGVTSHIGDVLRRAGAPHVFRRTSAVAA